MRKVFCDHCGKEISFDDYYVDENIEVNGETYDFDLCEKCHSNLEKLLAETMTEYLNTANAGGKADHE